MQRTFIKDLKGKIGETVLIKGWVDSRRDHGKLIFLDIRDGWEKVQAVVPPGEMTETAHGLRDEWTVAITALVKQRPEKMVNVKEANGTLELEVQSLEVITKAHELPFVKDTELNLDTYLDYLPLTLRTKRGRDITRVQATIIEAYRASLRNQGFTEFQSPVLVGGDAEGGAAAFSVNYYYDQKAYLATSPQFYKQIMVGAVERAFTTTKVFRGEKHATPRHLSEVTQLDFEMGFVQSHLEPMAVLEQTIKDTVRTVVERHGKVLKEFSVEAPLLPDKFPIFTLTQAQEIIEREFGGKAVGELDMEPEHERQICEWAKKEHNTDFVFITAFPTAKRAFYTYEEPSEAPFSRGFDLLFRGLEINSGAQRIHDYDSLVAKIQSRGMNPELFAYYLQAFKYGMPPHGGSSTGLERFTALMLGLHNIRETTHFPRDLNRIDFLLSKNA